ncbi:hypothetical protein HDU97_002717 [Phlyctochytrium planicorne]|nr:hypothetical protein HDU97_002717 [Phlyctochytrium planicorne]
MLIVNAQSAPSFLDLPAFAAFCEICEMRPSRSNLVQVVDAQTLNAAAAEKEESLVEETAQQEQKTRSWCDGIFEEKSLSSERETPDEDKEQSLVRDLLTFSESDEDLDLSEVYPSSSELEDKSPIANAHNESLERDAAYRASIMAGLSLIEDMNGVLYENLLLKRTILEQEVTIKCLQGNLNEISGSIDDLLPTSTKTTSPLLPKIDSTSIETLANDIEVLASETISRSEREARITNLEKESLQKLLVLKDKKVVLLEESLKQLSSRNSKTRAEPTESAERISEPESLWVNDDDDGKESVTTIFHEIEPWSSDDELPIDVQSSRVAVPIGPWLSGKSSPPLLPKIRTLGVVEYWSDEDIPDEERKRRVQVEIGPFLSVNSLQDSKPVAAIVPDERKLPEVLSLAIFEPLELLDRSSSLDFLAETMVELDYTFVQDSTPLADFEPTAIKHERAENLSLAECEDARIALALWEQLCSSPRKEETLSMKKLQPSLYPAVRGIVPTKIIIESVKSRNDDTMLDSAIAVSPPTSTIKETGLGTHSKKRDRENEMPTSKRKLGLVIVTVGLGVIVPGTVAAPMPDGGEGKGRGKGRGKGGEGEGRGGGGDGEGEGGGGGKGPKSPKGGEGRGPPPEPEPEEEPAPPPPPPPSPKKRPPPPPPPPSPKAPKPLPPPPPPPKPEPVEIPLPSPAPRPDPSPEPQPQPQPQPQAQPKQRTQQAPPPDKQEEQQPKRPIVIPQKKQEPSIRQPVIKAEESSSNDSTPSSQNAPSQQPAPAVDPSPSPSSTPSQSPLTKQTLSSNNKEGQTVLFPGSSSLSASIGIANTPGPQNPLTPVISPTGAGGGDTDISSTASQIPKIASIISVIAVIAVCAVLASVYYIRRRRSENDDKSAARMRAKNALLMRTASNASHMSLPSGRQVTHTITRSKVFKPKFRNLMSPISPVQGTPFAFYKGEAETRMMPALTEISPGSPGALISPLPNALGGMNSLERPIASYDSLEKAMTSPTVLQDESSTPSTLGNAAATTPSTLERQVTPSSFKRSPSPTKAVSHLSTSSSSIMSIRVFSPFSAAAVSPPTDVATPDLSTPVQDERKWVFPHPGMPLEIPDSATTAPRQLDMTPPSRNGSKSLKSANVMSPRTPASAGSEIGLLQAWNERSSLYSTAPADDSDSDHDDAEVEPVL